mgnify:CR=1 FL=1
MGDPSGIGPAITVKALNKLADRADFTLIGDSRILEKIKGFKSLLKSKVKVISLDNVKVKGFKFGQVRGEYGKASFEYLEKSLELLRNKDIECLITSPVSKDAITRAGIKFSGHTEYFINRTGARHAQMMLLNRYLKFTLATRHISLNRIAKVIDKELIYRTALVTYNSLRMIFAIPTPKIAICGLNPHASDNALFGIEEKNIITPALNKLKKKIKFIFGPLPADTAIQKAFKGEFNALIAMYHDQALIPLKLTGYDSGVNITLGLNFIRTSPLHGTAFDIAVDYKSANPNSLISAINLALKCALNQRKV